MDKIKLYCSTPFAYNEFPKFKYSFDDDIRIRFYDKKRRRTIWFAPEFYTALVVKQAIKSGINELKRYEKEGGNPSWIKAAENELIMFEEIQKQLKTTDTIVCEYCPDGTRHKKRMENVYVSGHWLTVKKMEKAIRFYLVKLGYVKPSTDEIEFVWSFWPFHAQNGKVNFKNYVQMSKGCFAIETKTDEISFHEIAKGMAKMLDSKSCSLKHRKEIYKMFCELCKNCQVDYPPPFE